MGKAVKNNEKAIGALKAHDVVRLWNTYSEKPHYVEAVYDRSFKNGRILLFCVKHNIFLLDRTTDEISFTPLKRQEVPVYRKAALKKHFNEFPEDAEFSGYVHQLYEKLS